MRPELVQSELFAPAPIAGGPVAGGPVAGAPATSAPAAKVPAVAVPVAAVPAATVADLDPTDLNPTDSEPADLEALAQACASCHRCGLAAGRSQVVVGRGNPRAALMVIGEGPGAQEDACGQPFVGRAGQLLDQMLASVGIDSNRDAYICNVVKCRPPGNRKPTPEEMAACRPWLRRQIALVDPAVILLAGATAMEGVLGVKGGITRLRGQWRQGDGGDRDTDDRDTGAAGLAGGGAAGGGLNDGVLAGRWLLPIFHPSYLLRNPSRERDSPKWLTWQDLQAVRRRLDQLASGLG